MNTSNSHNKRIKMSDNTKHSDLMLCVPDEIMKQYYKYLDLKSSVMFHIACSTSCCKDTIKRKEEESVTELLNNIIHLVKEVHEVFASPDGRHKLLARMLRKVIFVSVSDINSSTQSNVYRQSCLDEYNALYSNTREIMEGISITAFNDMLEDAQFEYRGFRILDLHQEKRTQLDLFKGMLEQKYFSKSFTIHTYLIYNKLNIELNYDGQNVSFDIHKDFDYSIVNGWMFFKDEVSEWLSVCEREATPCQLYNDFKNSGIDVEGTMLSWSALENCHAVTSMIARLIMEIMPYDKLFEGTSRTTVEVWNDSIESNWLMADIVDEVKKHEMYTDRLTNIAFDVQDEFNIAILC